MIEGLWVAKFLVPSSEEMELNGGVVVIESGRVLGGDSGYFYIGDLEGRGSGIWGLNLVVNRHDPSIYSIFGDVDTIRLRGEVRVHGQDPAGRHILMVHLLSEINGDALDVSLTKVSELP